MPPERRESVVAALAAADLIAIEDDVYGPLLPEPPTPLAALAPDRVIYLGSASKFLAPGIRLGLLAGPRHLAEHLASTHYLLSLGQGLLAVIVHRQSEGGLDA